MWSRKDIDSSGIPGTRFERGRRRERRVFFDKVLIGAKRNIQNQLLSRSGPGWQFGCPVLSRGNEKKSHICGSATSRFKCWRAISLLLVAWRQLEGSVPRVMSSRSQTFCASHWQPNRLKLLPREDTRRTWSSSANPLQIQEP